MESSQINIRRVNKFNVLLIWIFCLLLTAQAYAFTGISRAMLVFGATAGAGLIASVIVLFKVNDKASSIIIPTCPALSATILAVIEGGSLRIFIVYLIICCMAALYFSKLVLVAFTIGIDAIIIICTFILNKPLMGSLIEIKEVIIQSVLINIGLIVLYFLTKWGNDYLKSSMNNEKKSTELLQELKTTFSKVGQAAAALNKNIVDFMEYTESAIMSSEAVAKGAYEMAKGIEEEAADITSISSMMKDAQEKLKYVHEQSKAVESISMDVNNVAQDNGREIASMKELMKTVNTAVEQGLKTAIELKESMDNINEFLSSIKRIAEQTNLLALNAAIEASRAGDAGRGFGVVAEEIRKLSDESNNTANEISQVVSVLQQKANAAVETSRHGNAASGEGSAGLDKLGNSIENMVASFEKMKNYIKAEFKSVDEIKVLFDNIDSHLENNAAIMQEHSATTEEITASMDEQNAKINEMANIIKNIEKLSSEMAILAQQQ
ncbi:methyl-accepting chemotaxis protein 4 [Oxobacter pfennigii]|uniref:Methyl-accepting chemotaxis protein 4 n=1 Tax=Oxobacter pfennigii TaxID=36849 RepID=A0A0P9AJG2_9CLOT|nr:methyl-accepting chemotaxis protein [Oxobacter pfennigii]KPU45546.1 methyl-accepting chemotaxis protein 4 [Oxobacter pfennigii]